MVHVDSCLTQRALAVAAFLGVTSAAFLAEAQTPPPFVKADAAKEWTMPAKDVASTRYSSLDQINAGNARDLKVAFSFSLGTDRGAEAAPLVVGDTMYVVTPYPNTLFALDLKQSGALKWRYDPLPSAASQGEACCDVVNRGAVFADGKLIYNTLDDYTIAVDAASGKEVWRTKMGDINMGETMTMAPLLMKDKVLVGDSGGEMGVRGWGAALDVKTGKIVWRAYSTGPDSDVLIGAAFKPFYDSDKGKDLGVTTWPADMWRQGGGSVWGWASYDPELNLVYYGVSNPGPWNSSMRPGDNKWTSGIFARDADTGQARWFYQYSPHDLYDYDGVNEEILLDMPWKGQPRKVLVHPDRNGYVYVLDRVNGEVLSAEPFQKITSSTGVDLKTGRLQYVAAKQPKLGETVRDICPAPPGAKDWQPSAFSNKTKLLYLPHNNLCFDTEEEDVGYIAGTPYVGASIHMHAGEGENRGEYAAWDILNGKKVWAIQERFPVWSGTVVTAGDVAFYGTMDGWFKAINANTGELLWQFKTGSGIIGQPVTYLGPDGKQYVAVLSGVGGWSGAIVAGGIDKRDGTAALGFVNAMKDLPEVTTKGGELYVFALP
ncbi:PQQ-dependent dehydrogenase, methanol/ethanol family [Methylocella silvestris BL2]|uniref:PQQ-dependent dehydrogenase, methanol/ethanol family n=1 Tax=Methylocella silvestris (strain DSM 15510 / CIP 108128 / LMG 27833 / NCIMB 13906 / BL2) TaxID=395965 RepID=B8ES75_METSB|nr:methanol/ethanol family PQQ-dependent dehydrogenase [Methylocella silvestris]ACK52290.1 PQQ-dependent dehydrogenase, methanol/ethanol family [Methylocella silvestris BL2]